MTDEYTQAGETVTKRRHVDRHGTLVPATGHGPGPLGNYFKNQKEEHCNSQHSIRVMIK